MPDTTDSLTDFNTEVNNRTTVRLIRGCLLAYAARYEAAGRAVTPSPLVPLNRHYYLAIAARCRAWAAALAVGPELAGLLLAGALDGSHRLKCGGRSVALPKCDPPGPGGGR